MSNGSGGRYGGADPIYTRMGVSVDTHRFVGKDHKLRSYSQKQFQEITGLGISSMREKLRDNQRWGFIKKTGVDTYTNTELGDDVLEDGEKCSKAIEKALYNSPLWNHLLTTIGKNPDRNTFDNTIKKIPHLANIGKDALDNLWTGYNADIKCITKSPPFATRTQPPRNTTKTEITSQRKNDEITTVKTQVNTHKFLASPSIMQLINELPRNEKLTIQYGTFKFEVNDSSSAIIARFLISAKEHGMKFGDDYDKK